VTGNYILGNGSQLTGISVSSSRIFNGLSEVDIAAANANATVSIAGTSNVAVFANTGVYVTGVVSSSGNIIGGGTRSTTSASPPASPAVGDVWYDDTTDTLFRFVYDGTNYFWQDLSGGSIAANVQPYGNSNVSAYLANFDGNISATGNIQGNFILGNGSQLTGVTAGLTTGKSLAITLIMGG
jgi:hypothetical protein